ncbi:zonadhesin-like [Anopheles bellator]|uniref:zonadhesin-like n=1 Tax=Anopheles bellator TaxID=139047 RepID=UPI00264845E7|nr:zonadhesin-like [Anopheles bellator]
MKLYAALSLVILGVAVANASRMSNCYVSCGDNEVLRPTAPCCQDTCDMSCRACDYDSCKLVYKPTCVCKSGYVRYNGKCVQKTCCPSYQDDSDSDEYVPQVWQRKCDRRCPCGKTFVCGTDYSSEEQYYPCGCKTLPPCCTTTTTPAPTTTTPPPTTTTPPPTTTTTEELVFRRPSCEPTCDDDCSDDSCPVLLVEEPTCACRPGYVRYQGHCITKASCPRSVSRYQLFVPQQPRCSARCGTPNRERRDIWQVNLSLINRATLCTMRTVGHKRLRAGVVLFAFLVVILQSASCKECGSSKDTSVKCAPFEVLRPDKPCCEPTCEDDCSHAICRRAQGSYPKPTCVCRQGLVRHAKACIPRQMCPPHFSPRANGPYRPAPLPKPVTPKPCTKPPPTKPPQPTCGPNEQLFHCRQFCVPTCKNDCSKVLQPRICIPETSCICKPGYVRHEGRCIPQCDCPKRPQPLPLSGEYVEFEVVSVEGGKSDEDFDFPFASNCECRKDVKRPAQPAQFVPTCPKPVPCTTPKPVQPFLNYGTTERNIYPPVCSCRHKLPSLLTSSAAMPDPDRTYESTEEELSDIVPYALPVPRTGIYPKPCLSPYPPKPQLPSLGHYYGQRPTLPRHRCDYNEPLDHFLGTGSPYG